MTKIDKYFLSLIESNKGILYKISKSYADTLDLQEDLRQEMILNLWKGFQNFEGKSLFSTWMYKVCLNTALLYIRKSYRQSSTYLQLEIESVHLDSHQFLDPTEERIEKLYAAIRTLKPIDRSIILLYLEEMSYKEISKQLGIENGNLRVRILRIKEQLKKILN